MFRIQKLLLAEYQELYEPIIVENPFTQVNAKGEGIRQYHIGLTISKLIIGCDDFKFTCLEQYHNNDTDPEIETFNLVSLLPLEFVKMQFYRRNYREIMQLILADDDEHPLYFEIGGHKYRNLFWNTWRERVATIRLTQPLFDNIPESYQLHVPEEDDKEDAQQKLNSITN